MFKNMTWYISLINGTNVLSQKSLFSLIFSLGPTFKLIFDYININQNYSVVYKLLTLVVTS